MRSLLLVACVLALSGCASFGAESRFKTKMDAYVGQSLDALILRYGEPTAVSTLSTGIKVYQYNFDFGTRGTAAVMGNMVHTATSNEWCHIKFLVDPATNLIQSYTAQGNTCAAKRSGSVF